VEGGGGKKGTRSEATIKKFWRPNTKPPRVTVLAPHLLEVVGVLSIQQQQFEPHPGNGGFAVEYR
jgi:hypothetical protein